MIKETMSEAKIHKRSGVVRFIRNFWPLILAILVFTLTRLAHKYPGAVERYYSSGLYPVLAKVLSTASRTVPFSLWDLFWSLVVLVSLCGFILMIFRIIKPRRYFLRLVQLLSLLYTFFYLAWGFNYFRPGIETRLGWKNLTINESNFRDVLDTLISRSNKFQVKINLSDYKTINDLLEESYRNNAATLGIDYPNGTRRPKPMIYSSYFAKSGVSGYFGPYFNEINLNQKILPMDYPFTLAHEKAHQFGFTSEAEANFAAYVVCTNSDDMRLKYSGYLFMLLYFLNDARQMPYYHDFISKLDKSVLADIMFRNKYYDDLQNRTLEKIQTAANDVYLKSNNIRKGIENYNQVVRLVLQWYDNSPAGKQ